MWIAIAIILGIVIGVAATLCLFATLFGGLLDALNVTPKPKINDVEKL